MKHMKTVTSALAGLALIATTSGAVAQDDPPAQAGGTDLATAATNPVGSANQLQFQGLYFDDSFNSDGDAKTFILQPIVSFNLPEGGYFSNVVTRWTVPLRYTPEIETPLGGIDESGLGDTLGLIFPTHTTLGDTPGEFTTWGPGVAVNIPTSSEPLLGTNTWSAGPGLVYLKNLKFASGNSLMIGGAVWHIWDISGKADVSATTGFPAFIYKFDKLFDQDGWYVRAPDDTFSYDHKANEFTQAPIGLGVGRAFVMGKQPVNIFASAWKNVANPDTATTPKWALKASFSLVFPK
ncbi:MAG: hypothetical protein PVI41_00860 [Roseobacter sp.]